MHAKIISIQMLLYTFQSNCAKGLHFSAFYYTMKNAEYKYDVINYNYKYNGDIMIFVLRLL